MSRTDPHLVDLEEQIAETREALGQTVEELAAKVDVPMRAKAKAREAAARLRDAETRTLARAADARNRTREGAERVRHSAGAARAHLPGGGSSSAAGSGPPPDGSGAHLAVVSRPAPPYVPAFAAFAAGALIAVAWARHHVETSRS